MVGVALGVFGALTSVEEGEGEGISPGLAGAGVVGCCEKSFAIEVTICQNRFVIA